MKQKLVRIIKIIAAVLLITFALGYCGQMDSEYEEQRAYMATGGKEGKLNYE